VHVSTDYVFDGESDEPYLETDPVGPLSAYARTKLSGEVHAGPDATIVRTSWLVGVTRRSIITAVLDQAADPDRQLRFVADQWGSPTSATDLAEVLVAVLDERPAGVFHGINEGRASRYDIARLVLAEAGHDPDRVAPVPASDIPSTDGVVRPRDTALANTRLPAVGVAPLRSWEDAFRALVAGVLAT
jgi:dTDP-4-dehydrorhamnose reductase